MLDELLFSILRPKRTNSGYEMALVQNRRKDILILEDNELCSFSTKQFVFAYNIVAGLLKYSSTPSTFLHIFLYASSDS